MDDANASFISVTSQFWQQNTLKPSYTSRYDQNIHNKKLKLPQNTLQVRALYFLTCPMCHCFHCVQSMPFQILPYLSYNNKLTLLLSRNLNQPSTMVWSGAPGTSVRNSSWLSDSRSVSSESVREFGSPILLAGELQALSAILTSSWSFNTALQY